MTAVSYLSSTFLVSGDGAGSDGGTRDQSSGKKIEEKFFFLSYIHCTENDTFSFK